MIKRTITEVVEEYGSDGLITRKTTTTTQEDDDNPPTQFIPYNPAYWPPYQVTCEEK